MPASGKQWRTVEPPTTEDQPGPFAMPARPARQAHMYKALVVAKTCILYSSFVHAYHRYIYGEHNIYLHIVVTSNSAEDYVRALRQLCLAARHC